MIEEPLVVVLGAGASKHLGYPLGSQLLGKCLKTKPEIVSRLNSSAGVAYDELRGFQEHLRQSGAQSIDEFLSFFGLPTRQYEIGKLLLAAILVDEEHERGEFKSDNNWYGYLFSKLCEGSKALGDMGANKLRIVTFNYERSLEAYIVHRFCDRWGVTSDKAVAKVSEWLEVVHLYGALGGPLFATPTGTTYGRPFEDIDLHDVASQIHVIPDDRKKYEADFGTAAEWIANSRRTAFLGFAYEKTNVGRLALDAAYRRRAAHGGPPLIGTSVGLTVAEAASAGKRLCTQPGVAFISFPIPCKETLRETDFLDVGFDLDIAMRMSGDYRRAMFLEGAAGPG